MIIRLDGFKKGKRYVITKTSNLSRFRSKLSFTTKTKRHFFLTVDYGNDNINCGEYFSPEQVKTAFRAFIDKDVLEYVGR